MEHIIIQYKKLKELLQNCGCEENMIEVGWNDGIYEAMEKLLKNIPKDIANMIRLGYL